MQGLAVCEAQQERVPEQVCRRRRLRDRAVSGLDRGAVSVECALVLPLFFMVMLTLILMMDAVKLQAETNLELSNRARKLSMAAGAAGTWLEDRAEVSEGRSAAGTDVWIDLAKTVTYPWPFALPGLPKLKLAVRARVYPWSGTAMGIGGGGGSSREGEESVFLSDNAEVWHSHEDCTHLDLAVFQSTTGEVEQLRNAYGSRYRKCPGFPEGYSGPVYLTEKGEYYYPTPEYGSLTRHVRVVLKRDAGTKKQCERCAARDAA